MISLLWVVVSLFVLVCLCMAGIAKFLPAMVSALTENLIERR